MSILKKIFLIFFFFTISIVWYVYLTNKDLFELSSLFLHIDKIKNYLSNNYLSSIVIYIFTYCLLIICNFPIASLLSMIGGFLFGTWVGGIGIIIGATLGSFIVFVIAKTFFYNLIKKKILNKYLSISNSFKKNDLELMLLIRIIPGIPFFAQNLILAGLGANKFKFFYTTLIGLIPWAFIFASIGEGLEKIFFEDQKLNFYFFMKVEYLLPIFIMLIIIILIRFFKKNFK